jgi:hypothetical protein
MGLVVPYRNREKHLRVFAPHVSMFFQTKNIDFKLYVIEQTEEKIFNQAKLMNIGFDISKDKHDYFAFHDVDMIPYENVDYSYPDSPTHLAANATQHENLTPTHDYFGGIVLFNKEDFLKINGFSNEYWDWGGVDFDLLLRCQQNNLPIVRRTKGWHLSLDHKPSYVSDNGIPKRSIQENVFRLELFKHYLFKTELPNWVEKIPFDPQSGLSTLDYEVVDLQEKEFYNLAIVKI